MLRPAFRFRFPHGIARFVADLGLLLALCLPVGIATAAERFGEVWRLHGEITRTGQDSPSQALKAGDAVFPGDRIRSGRTGELVIRTRDDAYLALRPNSELRIDSYATDEAMQPDTQALHLATGALRVITGWLGRLKPERHRLTTPTATIGIRGTDHEVLILSDGASDKPEQAGTYDRVNRGGTRLAAGGGQVDIDAGRTGFARDPASVTIRTRALMTLLMPRLLEKTPAFFVPGRFDGELDRLSGAAPPPVQENATTPTTAEGLRSTHCDPQKTGREWLTRLDRALARGDAPALLALFAADMEATASVRLENGDLDTRTFPRDDLVASTLQAVRSLKDYRQQRPRIDIAPLGAADGRCPRIEIRSRSIEQGRMDGRSYRFESEERFVLEQRDGVWLAISASTRQH